MCNRSNANDNCDRTSYPPSSSTSSDHSPSVSLCDNSANNFQLAYAHPPPGAVGICAVCGDRADGHHYGVLSCRGCNAFFRRAVTFNLQFHCRRDGHCDINKNARCACRACRLQKCQSVGMDRSAVQVRREMKDVLSLGDAQQRRTSTSTDLLVLPLSQSVDPPFPTHSPVLDSGKTLDSLSVRARLLGSASSSSSPMIMHRFDRLSECYFCQRYRRQTMLCQTAEQILTLVANGIQATTAENGCASGSSPSSSMLLGCRVATVDDLCQVHRVETVLMFEWVDQLEEFKQMGMEPDKIRLLRAFAPRFLLLDFLFHSLECRSVGALLLPNGTALVSPSGSNSHQNYTHQQQFARACVGNDAWDGGEGGMGAATTATANNDRTMEKIAFEAAEIVRTLLGPIAHEGVTFGEMIALRLLLLWDCSVPLESITSADIVRQAAERTRNELAVWLEQHSVHGAEAKMDTLLAIVPTLCAFAAKFADICRSITNFHVMREWQFMADLLDEGKALGDF